MRLSRALQDKMMDVRLRDKLLAEGKVTKEQVQAYLAELPDDESKAVYVSDEELFSVKSTKKEEV